MLAVPRSISHSAMRSPSRNTGKDYVVERGSGLLPYIVVTSCEGGREGNGQARGKLVQLRLLRMDAKYRSLFLYEQIEAFEDKVYKSYEQFNVDMLHRMFLSLTKRTVVDVRKIKTISNLRQCYRDLRKMIRCKLRHRNVQTTPEEQKLVNYFTWFFQYLDYLKNLRDNFTTRIYTPLFRYFYSVGYDQPDREDTTNSDLSSPSALSYRSHDSGYSGLSGLTSFLADDRSSARSRADIDDIHLARRKMITKNALLLLAREFNDIKKLYDTTELEKLAQRMSHLKDRMDHLLDVDTKLDSEMLTQDSGQSVFHLKMKHFANENVLRLIPDILIKFQKQAWLARRWLERDDEKTKDLNVMLDKLTVLEEDMTRRMSSLSKEIQIHEQELESQTSSLTALLLREERSNNLGQSCYDIKNRKAILIKQLIQLNTERNELSQKLTEASHNNDKKAYSRLKPLYDRNKLQRFAMERQIATLNYHINLMESDMTVELEMKPSMIHSTNDVQDKCEEIEQKIEKAKKEQKAIQAALIPVVQDRKFIKEHIHTNENTSQKDTGPVMRAEYVSSQRKESVADLGREFLQVTPRELQVTPRDQKVKMFITSLTEEDYSTPVELSMEELDTSQQMPSVSNSGIEVMASEW